MAWRTWGARDAADAGHGDAAYLFADRASGVWTAGEGSALHEQQGRASGKVGIDRFALPHRHTHRWGADQIRDLGVVGGDDQRVADEQFAVAVLRDGLADRVLDGSAEAVEIERIDPSVHESEAVGRRDDRVDLEVKDRRSSGPRPSEGHRRTVAMHRRAQARGR
jgi:hypothetical protein